MRTLTFISALVIICNLLVSCEPKTSEKIVSTSADGSLVIEITGRQEDISEPWFLSVVAKKGGQTIGPVYAQLWASEPNSENVLIDWKSNTSCVVSIHHRDGEVQKIPVTVD